MKKKCIYKIGDWIDTQDFWENRYIFHVISINKKLKLINVYWIRYEEFNRTDEDYMNGNYSMPFDIAENASFKKLTKEEVFLLLL